MNPPPFRRFVWWKPALLGALGILGILIAAYGALLQQSFQQFEEAFQKPDPFIPTRIYSDLQMVQAPLKRQHLIQKLQQLSLAYVESRQQIRFQLPLRDYPLGLLPTQHPQRALKTETTFLIQFQQISPEEPIQTITTLEGESYPSLYLPPVTLATISRSEAASAILRTSIPLDEMPPTLWKAFLAIEDAGFLEHKGIEWKGLARALWVNLRTRSFAQGGSTITQQLIKNLLARRSKNIFRKVNETLLALLVESRYEKEAILERYLNEVYLGQVGGFEVHGIYEGAFYFFGKRAQDLLPAESALLAGLVRGPMYYSPYRFRDRALQRQQLVLRRMQETGMLAPEECDAALKEVLRFAPQQAISNRAPYFVDYVKAELQHLLPKTLTAEELKTAGFKIYTTLDLDLNKEAQNAVFKEVEKLTEQLAKKNKTMPTLEGALVAMDPQTGYVKALIGGKNYALSNFNRILNMKRQVGSTFKPIVYLAALLRGETSGGVPIGGGTPVWDGPVDLRFDRDRQHWSPQNYGKTFVGWTSLRKALTTSINTVAAQLGFWIGPESLADLALLLGASSSFPKVPSIALGSAELSPMELLRMYATLANEGIRTQPMLIRSITWPDGTPHAEIFPETTEVAEEGAVALLNTWLQDVFTEGTGKRASSLGWNIPAAGKTGTTNEYRDTWFAGFVPNLATVVWVGTDQATTESKLKLTGAQAALPVWVSFMKSAAAMQPLEPFKTNEKIESLKIDQHTGMLASPDCPSTQVIQESYHQGHLPSSSTCAPSYPDSWEP